MSALLRYSLQPDSALLVESRVGIGWQTIIDGATGAPMDLREEMIAAGGQDGAQIIWDRLFKASRYLRDAGIQGVDA